MTQATRERQLRWDWGLAAAAAVALAFRLVHFTDRSLRPPDLHVDQIAWRETHPQAVRAVGRFWSD